MISHAGRLYLARGHLLCCHHKTGSQLGSITLTGCWVTGPYWEEGRLTCRKCASRSPECSLCCWWRPESEWASSSSSDGNPLVVMALSSSAASVRRSSHHAGVCLKADGYPYFKHASQTMLRVHLYNSLEMDVRPVACSSALGIATAGAWYEVACAGPLHFARETSGAHWHRNACSAACCRCLGACGASAAAAQRGRLETCQRCPALESLPWQDGPCAHITCSVTPVIPECPQGAHHR